MSCGLGWPGSKCAGDRSLSSRCPGPLLPVALGSQASSGPERPGFTWRLRLPLGALWRMASRSGLAFLMEKSCTLLKILYKCIFFINETNNYYCYLSFFQAFICSLLCANSLCWTLQEGIGLKLPSCTIYSILTGLFSQKQNHYLALGTLQ